MSIIDAHPYPWDQPEARRLHRVLTELYPSERRAIPIAEDVGIKEQYLTLGQPAFYLWREILSLSATRQLTRKLVEYVRDNNLDNINRPYLDALLANKPVAMDLEPRKKDGTAIFLSGSQTITRPETLLFHDNLSVSVGRVPAIIQSLQKMLELSPSVCLLRVFVGESFGHGTAFRIGEDLLLTNHHVLFPEGAPATKVIADFGFEADARDEALAMKSVPCDRASILSSAQDDWGIIRVTSPLDPAWPRISLAQAALPVEGEGAFILQHPMGGMKRLAFTRNTVTFVDDRVIHYLTDTETGSSGAPVFNAQGQLIALHHAGGLPQEVAGKQPLTKNEGLRIPPIHKVLAERGLL